jgi:hypothetical protein
MIEEAAQPAAVPEGIPTEATDPNVQAPVDPEENTDLGPSPQIAEGDLEAGPDLSVPDDAENADAWRRTRFPEGVHPPAGDEAEMLRQFTEHAEAEESAVDEETPEAGSDVEPSEEESAE